jgi:hypothetical protein
MISEHTVLRTPIVVTHTWRAPNARRAMAVLETVAHSLTHTLVDWARLPIMPYAPLWEASVVVSFIREQPPFEADLYSSETPFLTDPWLRG